MGIFPTMLVFWVVFVWLIQECRGSTFWKVGTSTKLESTGRFSADQYPFL
jgi:hypothetical protein